MIVTTTPSVEGCQIAEYMVVVDVGDALWDVDGNSHRSGPDDYAVFEKSFG